MVERAALRMPADTPAAIERSPGVRALYQIASASADALCAAKWRLDDCQVATGGLAHHILAYRTSGSAMVTRRTWRGSLRRRPAIGSVTFAAADTSACWSTEGASEAWHVYIPASALRRFAEQELELSAVPAIADFFGEVDPWLRGYFQMLDSEADVLWASGQPVDTPLLEETGYALLRHLFRAHSDLDVRGRATLQPGRASVPLQGRLMRRVQDYIDANLGAEIHLHDLAALGYMSPGHFLRRFRATCGTTPYQYVLEQRLQRARALLVEGSEPIARIAQSCGFRTASHLSSRFHARFGLPPSSCRDARRPALRRARPVSAVSQLIA